MRTALAFALPLLLLACGAEAPTGPAPTDASTDVAADAPQGDASCDFTRQRLIPGRGCVSATPENCDGMACARGLICNDESGPDGGTIFRCIMDPGG
jgi:hypothetical protein